jgi:hypothetical protein
LVYVRGIVRIVAKMVDYGIPVGPFGGKEFE